MKAIDIQVCKHSYSLRCALVQRLIKATIIMIVPSIALSQGPTTLPANGEVTVGQADITKSGNKLMIEQSTNKAAITWDRFSIGSNARVDFNQPNTSSMAVLHKIGQL